MFDDVGHGFGPRLHCSSCKSGGCKLVQTMITWRGPQRLRWIDPARFDGGCCCAVVDRGSRGEL